MENLRFDGVLKRTLKETEAVIGVRDIVKLASFERSIDRLDTRPINDAEICDLLRNVKNREGRKVYGDISVSTHELNGDKPYAMQMFAYSEKVSSLINEINPTFGNLGFGSMLSAPPLVIKYKSYAAIYLPIIVETLPKALFNEAIHNLQKRVKTMPTMEYAAPQGDVSVDLEKMLAKAKSILDEGDMLAVIRDGTHRAYLAAMQSSSPNNKSNGNGHTNIVIVNNSSGSAHSIPISISDIVLVSEKPKNNEDRYPGFVQREMEYFKKIGVDG